MTQATYYYNVLVNHASTQGKQQFESELGFKSHKESGRPVASWYLVTCEEVDLIHSKIFSVTRPEWYPTGFETVSATSHQLSNPTAYRLPA